MAAIFRRDREVEDLEKEEAKVRNIKEQQNVGLVDLREEDNYVMLVGEERYRLQPHALDDPLVQELTETLLLWINDVLEERRIIVRDIVDDVYDGQVLSELIEQLTGQRFTTVGVTQSEVLQKARLSTVLEKIDKLFGLTPDSPERKWSIESIHSKDIVAILHLLVALASYFRCKHNLPKNVVLKRILLRQLENRLETKLFDEEITGYSYMQRPAEPTERDVFDKLFSEAPEKLDAVQRSLCQFASRVLQELDIVITDLSSQFHSGVNFILMMGLLEGYFVPLYQYHFNPLTVDNKIDNMKLVFKLMEQAGLPPVKVSGQDVVERDLKSTLRVLYAIFQRYKTKVQASAPSTT